MSMQVHSTNSPQFPSCTCMIVSLFLCIVCYMVSIEIHLFDKLISLDQIAILVTQDNSFERESFPLKN